MRLLAASRWPAWRQQWRRQWQWPRTLAAGSAAPAGARAAEWALPLLTESRIKMIEWPTLCSAPRWIDRAKRDRLAVERGSEWSWWSRLMLRIRFASQQAGRAALGVPSRCLASKPGGLAYGAEEVAAI